MGLDTSVHPILAWAEVVVTEILQKYFLTQVVLGYLLEKLWMGMYINIFLG
ncbi:MAG: hypothetical protein MJE68_17025 [Proteobacteria bacterium]|nr:hypothetical protein [Pseudomonadota bacterium]